MDLLIDAGNSRIKWAYDQDGELVGLGGAEYGETLPHEAVESWLARAKPQRVSVANVAGESFAAKLETWLAQHWQLVPDYIRVEPRESGLALAYQQPERLGVDRWLAMLAARRLSDGAVAVVDAGTAMTVDVVDAEGRHLGGIILPGLRLMADMLKQKSSGIQQGVQGDAAEIVASLGRDTSGCIEQGALFAASGAIEHLLSRVQQQTTDKLSVIICGGDAERVMAELNCNCRYVPDLVLQGIQIIKGD